MKKLLLISFLFVACHTPQARPQYHAPSTIRVSDDVHNANTSVGKAHKSTADAKEVIQTVINENQQLKSKLEQLRRMHE